MGIILSLLTIPVFNRMVKLHQDINGKWISYSFALRQLLQRRKHNKTNRIMTHDVWKDNLRDGGIMPFPHEWEYDCPHKNKSEDLLIYGVNSSKQSIKIAIKFRTSNDLKNKSAISLRFDDNDGNYYTLEEESDVEYKKKEYKISGLTVEILAPFKRKTIRFRGYLTKNGQQLVFVKFRFVWLALSRVYDFTHDFDDHFMAKEWTNCKTGQTDQQFEDRLEQFGQIKGTFVEEDRPQRVLYFWGSFSKKYLESKPMNRRIIRIVGYNKSGIGFDLGFLSNDNGFEYRFGFLFEKKNGFKKLMKTSLEKNDLLDKSSNFSFKALFGENEYKFQIKENNKSLAKDLIIDGNKGMCYIFEENENEFQEPIKTMEKPLSDSSLVLGLNEENAKSVELTGGKGSSLAVLMSLSQQLIDENYENKFSVGNGVVVTTNAYQRLLEEYNDIEKAIQDLEKSTDISRDDLKTKCHNLENLISDQKLPQIIAKEIEIKLKDNFNYFENKLFAVRSSGASEDSEEMSTAGQMTTYLGVKGLEQIKQSVMKCWSSQFSYIAFEYKRGYGQHINSPMAVVIQEMIACESAGVMFTCDPISGDERIIEITGNYGLGESVVSASSEPDTIKMSVNIESNSLSKRRTIKGIASKVIGAKKISIKLLENGGTVEEEVFDKEKCCISDEDLYHLADIGLRIQRHYGNARDIEWGLKGGQIFMLQSRPVTNLDQSLSEYEVMHELDSPHPTEFEIYSRTHWGEILPGSSSWIVFTWTWGNKSRGCRGGINQGRLTLEDYNPYTSGSAVQYNQLMTNIGTGSFPGFPEYPDSKRSVQMVLQYFGHHIEDEDVLNLFKEGKKRMKKPSILKNIKMNYDLFYNLYFGPKNLIKDKTEYIDRLKYNSLDNIRATNPKTSKDILNSVMNEHAKIGRSQGRNHPIVSNGCHMKNLFLKTALEGAQENNPNLENDYNLLISSCEDVISAEVPNTLREIAILIKDRTLFTQMSDEEALKTLKEGTDEASQKFAKLLSRHGHRGYKEFDPMCLPWADDPIPCVKTIKGILLGNESQLIPKVVKSVDEVINELKTPLSFWRKLLIRKLLLPWSRAGIAYRELSKYFMIWMFNHRRQTLHFLAKRMVTEGLIPDVNTFFYLTSEEIDQLIDGERDPVIHMRARLRKRYFPKMCKYKFDEFIKGPEMKPRNFDEKITAPKLTDGLIQLKGTPVSIGTVKARVCVAEDITEADNIQSGDILITYSTDIGWSPYFPLISGIVTEIGGTASHGVVIAREYGIPSLITVEGACRAFKTGDICVLDTPSATITKVL